MQRSSDREWTWACLAVAACGLSLVHCGGRTGASDDTEAATSDNGDADGGTGGSDCEPALPCAGTAGNVDPTTQLRTLCGGEATVNRRGTPVKICHHIE